MREMLVDDYFELQEKYQKKYGKVVVLQAVGQFFEVLQVNNNEEKIGEVTAVSEILNIVKTKKDKKNPRNDRGNPDLCGFPLASLHRCLCVLVAAGFTCVISEQMEGACPPQKVRREVTRVVSPGTFTEETHRFQPNILVCFAVKNEKQAFGSDRLRIACATFDMANGESSVYEIFDHGTDVSFSIAEGVRMVKSFNPREIILYGDVTVDLKSKLELGERIVHIVQTDPGAEKIKFMNDFLKWHYRDCGLLTPIEFLDLEHKMLGCIAFVKLLRFAYDHNEDSLRNLSPPRFLNDIRSLCLENNCVQQLNVLPTIPTNRMATPSNVHSLIDVVGFCKTPMGHRRLRDRLCRPLCVGADIIARQRRTEYMLADDRWQSIQNHLRSVGDIERFARKLAVQSSNRNQNRGMSRSDILKIWSGLDAVLGAFEMLVGGISSSTDFENLEPHIFQIQSMLRILDDTFDKSSLDCDDLGIENIFKEGHDRQLDEAVRCSKSSRARLEVYRRAFNDCLDHTNDSMVKLEYTDKDGWHLTTTKKRVEDLKKRLPITVQFTDDEAHRDVIGSIDVSQATSSAKFHTSLFKEAAATYIADGDLARAKMYQLFDSFCKEFRDHFNDPLHKISETITEIDLCACAAEAAVRRRWCRPVILDSDGSSCVIADEMRHPIVEAIQTDVSYVPSTIRLGLDIQAQTGGADVQDGILLYGCNSAGKSTLMKALGLSVILAQAGFFVPAKSFTIRPFTSVMTRILSNDDLFKGHSSFAVEMTELNSIMRRADDKTLVLGDEIANSTESTSGLAIVATAIGRLSRSRTKFVFATHLHELCKMHAVKTLTNVSHYHLEIKYDPEIDCLVYDRALRPGSGTAIYGLEIAKAMGMDQEFLSTAHSLRRELLGSDAQIVSDKSSHFNANLFMRPCQVCGEPGSDVHHIKEQCTADTRGFIDTIHKNRLSNLAVLCKKCHHQVHDNGRAPDDTKLKIHGYIQTSIGRKLEVTRSNCSEVEKTTPVMELPSSVGNQTEEDNSTNLLGNHSDIPRSILHKKESSPFNKFKMRKCETDIIRDIDMREITV